MSDTLPTNLPEPEWVRDLEDVTIETMYGTLTLRAMGDDDVFIDGALTWGGHTYQLPYGHTTNDGTLKAYASNGNDYGPATAEWQVRQAFRPMAPKTYAPKLAEIVRHAVREYLSEHADHAAENIRRNAVQDMNRKASDYNRKAAELAQVLAAYQDAARRAGEEVSA